MSLIEFPYILHKGYLLPIIPITILDHRVWLFVDSGATFSILSTDDARRIGIDWKGGLHQMVSVWWINDLARSRIIITHEAFGSFRNYFRRLDEYPHRLPQG